MKKHGQYWIGEMAQYNVHDIALLSGCSDMPTDEFLELYKNISQVVCNMISKQTGEELTTYMKMVYS